MPLLGTLVRNSKNMSCLFFPWSIMHSILGQVWGILGNTSVLQSDKLRYLICKSVTDGSSVNPIGCHSVTLNPLLSSQIAHVPRTTIKMITIQSRLVANRCENQVWQIKMDMTYYILQQTKKWVSCIDLVLVANLLKHYFEICSEMCPLYTFCPTNFLSFS